MTADLDVRMSQLYAAGASIRDVAAVSGRSPATVRRRLELRGVPRRPAGGGFAKQGRRVDFSPGQLADIVAAHEAREASLDEIGARYDVSGDTIARRLRAMGVALRPRGRTLTAANAARPQDRAPRLARPMLPPVELAVAYANAGTVRALARATRISEKRLRSALTAAGVRPASLRRIPVPARAEVARLAATGQTRDEIEELTGVPIETLERAGLGRPPRPLPGTTSPQ